MYVLLIKSEPGIFYCQPFTLAWYTLPDWRVIPCPRFVFYSRFLHFSPSLPSLFQDSSQVPTLSYDIDFTSVCSLSPPNCVRHLGLGFDDLDSFEEHFLLPQLWFFFFLVRLRLILEEITEAQGHFHRGLAGVHTSDVNRLCPIDHGLRSYLLGTHMITFLLVLLFPHCTLQKEALCPSLTSGTANGLPILKTDCGLPWTTASFLPSCKAAIRSHFYSKISALLSLLPQRDYLFY